MPLTIAICDDNEDQIKELRRLLGEWSADKPFALNIDEYINMIEKECRICRCEINYVQKEKMKEYLMKTF